MRNISPSMLELPHQMSDAITGGNSIPEIMLFMKKANEMFEKIKQRHCLQGITVIETVQFEKAFEGILTSNKKNEIDLIVVGPHGSSGLEEILVGSNTE